MARYDSNSFSSPAATSPQQPSRQMSPSRGFEEDRLLPKVCHLSLKLKAAHRSGANVNDMIHWYRGWHPHLLPQILRAQVILWQRVRHAGCHCTIAPDLSPDAVLQAHVVRATPMKAWTRCACSLACPVPDCKLDESLCAVHVFKSLRDLALFCQATRPKLSVSHDIIIMYCSHASSPHEHLPPVTLFRTLRFPDNLVKALRSWKILCPS